MSQDEGVGGGVEAAATRPGTGGEDAWHPFLRGALLAHLPLVLLLGLVNSIDLVSALLLLVAPAAALVGAWTASARQVRQAALAVGLGWCSVLIVLWSGGAAASHLHIILLVGLVGLYRTWLPVAVVGGTSVVLHLVVGTVAPDAVFAADSSLVPGILNVLAMLAAVGILALSWRGSAVAEGRLADRVSSAALQQAEERRRREVSAVYATVARRSQTLLERQITVIEQLEAGEKDPAALQQLFTLDHLATRMNREAASMLVLAGGEPTRRVIGAPPVAEVVRGAVGEIADYTRVDLDVEDDRGMSGPVVAPVLHLLSELLENATAYSPPGTRVRVQGRPSDDGGHRLQVIDQGIGLDDERLEEFNALLAATPDRSPRDTQRLGLEVVTRLAARLGVTVTLAHNEGRPGITAEVLLPAALLGSATPAAPATASEDVGAASIGAASRVPAGPTAASADGAVPASAPRWASATTRGGPVGSPRTAGVAPVAASVGEAPAPVVPAATGGPGLRWSYAGHLKPRTTVPEPTAPPTRRGRGSRTQVSRPAPRPGSSVDNTPPEDPLAIPTRPHGSAPGAAARAAGPAAAGPGASSPATDDPFADLLGAHADPAGGATPRSWAAEPRDAAGSRRSSQASEAARLLEGVGGPQDPAVRDDIAPSQEGADSPTPPQAPADATPPQAPADATPPQGTDVPEPRPPRRTAGVASTSTPATPGGLPRRSRGASLPPGLRAGGAEQTERDASLTPVSRQESRSLLSSYQSRLQAGRRAAEEQQAGRAPDTPDRGIIDDDDAGPTPTP